MLNRIESFLNGMLALSRLLERLMVDVVSAYIPWLSPIIPAWLAYSNLQDLGIPEWVSLSAALVVEGLGLAAVNTSLSLWQYNATKREKDQKAPVGIAILAAGFYLVTIIIVNAILDIDMRGASVRTLAFGLLSLLSIVAGIIIAIRANHARRLADIATSKAEDRERRRAARTAKHLAVSGPIGPAPGPAQGTHRRRAAFQTWLASRDGAGPPTAAEVMAQFPDVPRRTIYHWLEGE